MTELIRRVFLSRCGSHLGRCLVYSWDVVDVEIFLHHLLPTCGDSVTLYGGDHDDAFAVVRFMIKSNLVGCRLEYRRVSRLLGSCQQNRQRALNRSVHARRSCSSTIVDHQRQTNKNESTPRCRCPSGILHRAKSTLCATRYALMSLRFTSTQSSVRRRSCRRLVVIFEGSVILTDANGKRIAGVPKHHIEPDGDARLIACRMVRNNRRGRASVAGFNRPISYPPIKY